MKKSPNYLIPLTTLFNDALNLTFHRARSAFPDRICHFSGYSGPNLPRPHARSAIQDRIATSPCHVCYSVAGPATFWAFFVAGPTKFKQTWHATGEPATDQAHFKPCQHQTWHAARTRATHEILEKAGKS